MSKEVLDKLLEAVPEWREFGVSKRTKGELVIYKNVLYECIFTHYPYMLPVPHIPGCERDDQKFPIWKAIGEI